MTGELGILSERVTLTQAPRFARMRYASPCASPTSKPWSAASPTRCPPSFSKASPRSRSPPAPCPIPIAPRSTPSASASRSRPPTAASEGIQSRIVLYHGSFSRAGSAPAGVRLARGGVGDADPRAAAPPRVARPRAGARGVRPRGGAELRPPGRRGVRSALLPRRRARRRRRLPGGGRRLPRPPGGRAALDGAVPVAGPALPDRRCRRTPACRRFSPSTASPSRRRVIWFWCFAESPGCAICSGPDAPTQATVHAVEVYFSRRFSRVLQRMSARWSSRW